MNIGFNVAKVSRMSEADRYYAWANAVVNEMWKFNRRSDHRLEKYGKTPKVWYTKEAAARKRLILRLAAMIEEMDVDALVPDKRRPREPVAR